MVIEGKLHAKFDTQNVTATFRKRDFIVEYTDNPMYPQYISFQCTQDRCTIIDSLQIGDKVEVTFNLRGREWTNPEGEKKYFNTLEAWRVNKMESVAAVPAGGGGQAVYQLADLAADDSDDLPF